MSSRCVAPSLLILLIASALLAGCIGEEDVDPAELEGAEGSEEGLGTVSGRILTISLDPVVGATVRLVQDDEVAAEGQTEQQGSYRITNVEPGEYRLQVSAACCKENVRAVTVVADEVASVDIQLEPYSSDDLQEPRVEQREWRGFLACTLRWPTAGLPVYSGVNACGVVELGAPNATGDDFLHRWEIGPGLKTVVGAMEWRAPGAALGDELSLYMEVSGRPNAQPRYVSAEGPSPVEFRADAGWVEEELDEDHHEYEFNNVEDSLELMYRIFAGGDANIVYQQQFTVYWDLYYWEPAPEGATALPDL